jgi:predicted 3-demethylubiquinone-9 3-methyltransferase (glyoxalase superfamily)
MVMQKIIPHLWFDKEAKEAAKFYTSIFPDSRVNNVTEMRNTPSGDTDVVSFELWDQQFMAISAGPLFKFNPSISFMVNFDPLLFDDSKEEAREKLDAVWNKLAEGGKVLMPIDKYPFSERYGWVQDKYGLSWQLILTDPKGEPRPAIMPSFLFVDNKYGSAETAIDFYVKIFNNAQKGSVHRYGNNDSGDDENAVMFADFKLENTWFAAMDSAQEHGYDFNEAVSFLVQCEDQSEIDYYFKKLSAVPESEQCGWVKDKFGMSWQITPAEMQEMMTKGTREQVDRLTQAFLKMKKLDIAKLEKAFEASPQKQTAKA